MKITNSWKGFYRAAKGMAFKKILIKFIRHCHRFMIRCKLTEKINYFIHIFLGGETWTKRKWELLLP
jgi:hypothetical protein